MNRLNFGCGYVQPVGWVSVDKLDYDQPSVHRVDILDEAAWNEFLIKTGGFDMIHTNHVLHMFDWQQLEEIVLPRLAAALNPGGILRAVDFDPETAFGNYRSRNAKALIIPDDVEPNLDGKFCKLLSWYGTRKSPCTATFMYALLLRSGFGEAIVAGYRETRWGDSSLTGLDTRPDESWYIEAITKKGEAS